MNLNNEKNRGNYFTDKLVYNVFKESVNHKMQNLLIYSSISQVFDTIDANNDKRFYLEMGHYPNVTVPNCGIGHKHTFDDSCFKWHTIKKEFNRMEEERNVIIGDFPWTARIDV